MVRRAQLVSWLFAVATTLCCDGSSGQRDPVAWDELRLPSGLGIAPDSGWLMVTGGNWDAADEHASLVALSLGNLASALGRDDVGVAAHLAVSDICRPSPVPGGPTVCAAAKLIDPRASLALPDGAGNIVFDRPFGLDGPARLLTTSRFDGVLTWVDYHHDGRRLVAYCGQSGARWCDELHTIWGIDADPARISVDGSGFRYAYLPHLLGSKMTLIDLDGPVGPQIAEEREDFFVEDVFSDSVSLAGGFDVTQVPCDAALEYVPRGSQECRRPVAIVSQRFWNGFRAFSVVQDGGPRLQAVSDHEIEWQLREDAEQQPIFGAVVLEVGGRQPRMLAVQTTPPALLRIDLSLDAAGYVGSEVVDRLALCQDPNLIALHTDAQASGEAGPGLALVTCPGSNELAIIDLRWFRIVRIVRLGEGANEVAIDRMRQWAYVANTRESTISVVELDRTRRDFAREIAVIAGRGAPVARGGIKGSTTTDLR